MRRLTSAPPRLGSAPPRLASAATSGSGFQRDDRLSSAARGYGHDWRKAREAHLAREPLCRFCAAEGRVTAATDVDHVEPFRGIQDPMRLDPANLRSLCRPCHMARTARQAAGQG